jgi:CheY-like chemotaxis protein
MLALVVDDDSRIRTFIRAVLEREGFAALEAGGGNDGLTIVEELGGGVDLIVTDLQMADAV